ncbi:MAG TPA: hypothetical protein ENN76_00165 [Euryarchaeota archaeon]|nr:hypothetical protein [Euryarchaeota archaeon]
MRAKSGHIVFSEKTEYKHLAPVFEEVMLTFLKESKQTVEDPEYLEMLVKLNIEYLERNQKPEGYNRPGKMRLIFPIRTDGCVEMYIMGLGLSVETVRVTELLCSILNTHSLDHDIFWDDMPKKEDLL